MTTIVEKMQNSFLGCSVSYLGILKITKILRKMYQKRKFFQLAEIEILNAAINSQSIERVTRLLDSGINPEPVAGALTNPLELACEKKGREAVKIVKIMLVRGAEGNDQTPEIFPLYRACLWSNLSMFKMLLERDSTMLEKTNTFGENVLHLDARNLEEGASIIRYILQEFECGFKLLTTKDENGLEPHGAWPCLSCNVLAEIALNGGNLNAMRNKFPGHTRGIISNCNGDKIYPLRVAQKVLATVGYIFNRELELELGYHENYNQLTSDLDEEDRIRFDREGIVTSQI